ncbi:PEPxxWA-CTERM sorting domain-containing protein [Sphingomonas bacterium]|uniref:PEPxxWA-CTERM sorting domain-containing protein n=1 Tax=Sphingomonas bacterium TaxID=1895847 RepID=UPI0020C5B425|nr:PEPxxWA-CTERM sorting domain-containing protein [Sphingomonas bacterium]
MAHLLKRIAALLFGACFALSAQAITIVDTGQPTQTNGGYTLYSSQWLASEFNVTSAVNLTDVMGYMNFTGALRVAIYSDGGDLPGTKLYSATSTQSGTGWLGSSGLNWALTSGSYWVSFETDSGNGYMPYPSPIPLNQEAGYHPGAQGWYSADTLNLGVRIYGTAAVVPEPASWLMMVLGFGLGGVALRRAKARTPLAT